MTDQPKKYMCLFCSQSWDSTINRRDHMKLSHSDKYHLAFTNGYKEMNTKDTDNVETDDEQEKLI